ncbi:MAG: CoA transferase, partial [Alphaproteobacteria bacterium]|nr:CoA transferase [Alphaproteobacteria bacterium]
MPMTAPLAGVRIVEFAGMGPGPFAAMLLADLGAEIIRIDRAGERPPSWAPNPALRGRRSIALDLKDARGTAIALDLVARADALIEGYRPGVMEKRGLGPEVCMGRQPALVYGRITGWGQTGPLAERAGHDLNYVALTGALHAIGRHGQPPAPPLNILGDYAGGGAYLALGLVAAIMQARSTGKGQVVDAAMVDGAASLATTLHWMSRTGRWSEERGTNAFDSGDPFYDVYATADDRYISIAPIEPQFYSELRRVLGLDGPEWDRRSRADRPRQRAALQAIFRGKTRDEWERLFEGSDACFAPVLTPQEAPLHPHNVARGTFIGDGVQARPGPAPRLGG